MACSIARLNSRDITCDSELIFSVGQTDMTRLPAYAKTNNAMAHGSHPSPQRAYTIRLENYALAREFNK